MKIDIFFATKRLSICTTPTSGVSITPEGEFGITRTALLELFEKHSEVELIASDDSECQQLFESFAMQFITVTAAGGVVKSQNGDTLMIHRNGRWDLPKGHWEEGESIEECAIREVQEECGIQKVTLLSPLCQTLHCYYMRNKWELKRTHWYSMSGDNTTPLTPQQEEGIERAEWLSADEVKSAIKGSFPTIRAVIEAE